MFLTSSNLDGVAHGFFTRKGGVSNGLYASLNCGLGTGDDPAHVAENRRRVTRALGSPDAPLLSLYQVHSDVVVTVTKPWANENKPKADAMVTATPGIVIGVLAADCVPILFADRQARIIGAAHSGWKGTLAHIGLRTVEAMERLGAKRTRIAAAIGPCIGAASYEVSDEFRDHYLRHDASYARFFAPGTRVGHPRFDIRACVRENLAQAGISDINTLENDTYIEDDDFFSFRRTTHRRETDYGRQISAILLTPA